MCLWHGIPAAWSLEKKLLGPHGRTCLRWEGLCWTSLKTPNIWPWTQVTCSRLSVSICCFIARAVMLLQLMRPDSSSFLHSLRTPEHNLPPRQLCANMWSDAYFRHALFVSRLLHVSKTSVTSQIKRGITHVSVIFSWEVMTCLICRWCPFWIAQFGHQGPKSTCLPVVSERSWPWLFVVETP